MSRHEDKGLRALIYSVVLHAVIIIALFVGVSWGVSTQMNKAPGTGQDAQPIKATVVSEKLITQQRAKLKQAKARKQRAAAQAKKRERQRLQKLKRKREAAHKAAARAEAKKRAERKKAKEAAAARKKAAQAAARKKAQAKARAEAKARAAEKARKQLQKELAAEKAQRQQAASRSRAMGSYVAAIKQKVKRNWNVPPNTPKDLKCKVSAQQVSGGTVTHAKVLSCNGGQAVEQSIISAIYKASPFPKPAQKDLFERELEFTFTQADVAQ